MATRNPKTTAEIAGHPIHPMLIPFPLAFLLGTLVADAVGRVADNQVWYGMALWLNVFGIATALLAAVPGVIDYLYSVPPKSSGKKRATKHMLSNSGSVVMFCIALGIRGFSYARPSGWVLLPDLIGAGLLGIGGYLGGTLVYRNFIGPDHRYAGSGKWREQQVERGDGQPVRVADGDELKVDQMKLIRVEGRRVVLARTEQGYAAFDDHCTHRGGSLADGVLICGKVQCLWHGSQFDVRTGQVASGPAEQPIKTYPVEERDGGVWLTLSR
jgi:nitrite reductase/ring-hydroxylating ferredoxin subunit/uncharacterized membrane protein